MDPTTRQELHELLAALLDGALGPGQQERLRGLLEQSPDAREMYLAYCDLHADLALRGEARDVTAAAVPPPEIATPRPLPRLRYLSLSWGLVLVTAAAVLLAVGGWLRHRPAPPAAAPALATVVGADRARWSAGTAPTRDGLPAGAVGLEQGTARLRMTSGAGLLLRGPAQVELIDAKTVRVHRGSLTVDVPEAAIGFRIITPTADVVDLGTEFGVAVEADGATEVHVLRGIVVARPSGSDTVVPLQTREAARIDPLHGDPVPIRVDEGRFRTAALAAAAPRPPERPPRPPLPAGARVVFLGDRTTDRETHLLLINQALADLPADRAPRLFNAGVALPLSFQEGQLQELALNLRPTHAVLEFGPEIALFVRPRSQDDYEAAILRLADRLEREGIEPILCTGYPVGQVDPAAQERLDGYNRFLRGLARRRGYRLADAERHFRDAGRDLAELVTGRGLYPTFEGHRRLAAALLEALGHPDRHLADALQLSLLPGVLTDWRVRLVPEGEALTAESVQALSPDAWQALTLPQKDGFGRRLVNPSHTILYRDRQRGFATDLHHEEGKVVQAVAYVDSDRERGVWLNTGATLRGVWLNGEKVLDSAGGWNGWHAGRERVPARLRAGRNTVVVEARNSFFLSVTDAPDWGLPRPLPRR